MTSGHELLCFLSPRACEVSCRVRAERLPGSASRSFTPRDRMRRVASGPILVDSVHRVVSVGEVGPPSSFLKSGLTWSRPWNEVRRDERDLCLWRPLLWPSRTLRPHAPGVIPSTDKRSRVSGLCIGCVSASVQVTASIPVLCPYRDRIVM